MSMCYVVNLMAMPKRGYKIHELTRKNLIAFFEILW